MLRIFESKLLQKSRKSSLDKNYLLLVKKRMYGAWIPHVSATHPRWIPSKKYFADLCGGEKTWMTPIFDERHLGLDLLND